MKLLMAAAECSPLARTGGMGEAVAGLAKALAGQGIEVTVAIPRYRHLGDTGTAAADAPVPAYRYELDGFEVLLLDDAEAFDRPGIYGPKPGEAYEDEWFRWHASRPRLLAWPPVSILFISTTDMSDRLLC